MTVWRRLRLILEMIRFSHTLFALPFALLAGAMAWAADAAGDPPRPWRSLDLLGIVLCMVAARSAGMAINRLADRKIDAANPRTAMRHLPAGVLSTGSVALFAAGCSAAFVAATLLFLPNRLPLYLSLPVLAILAAYSYTKRFTSLSHFWLGLSLMLAPISAWIAIRGEILLENPVDVLPAVVLGAAVLFWVAGFDIIYACQDVDFDRKAGLNSVPAKLGVRNSLWLAAACHAVMIALLVALPIVATQISLGWIYIAGIAAVAILLIYEHALVRPDDLSRVNQAFFNVNAIISLGLLAVGVLDLWL
jgi:4-hydroxybenzoate polyprenyltransferase